MKQSSIQKCYYCNDILEDKDLVIKPFPLVCRNGKVRMYKRKFHMWCLPKYIKSSGSQVVAKQEMSGWDKVYQYFKISILNLPVGQNLDNHSVERLLGLHVGQFKPNGSNIRGLERGYSWEAILITMQMYKNQILTGFETMKFNNSEHKTNFAMKIITDNINFVKEKLDAATKQREKVDRLSQEIKEKPKFKRGKYKPQGRINPFGDIEN